MSFQTGLRIILRALEAGALGAEAEEALVLCSDQRDLLTGFVAGTIMRPAALALSLTTTMSFGRESIKLERAKDVIIAMRKVKDINLWLQFEITGSPVR